MKAAYHAAVAFMAASVYATPVPQGVTIDIPAEGETPEGCTVDYDGVFGITARRIAGEMGIQPRQLADIHNGQVQTPIAAPIPYPVAVAPNGQPQAPKVAGHVMGQLADGRMLDLRHWINMGYAIKPRHTTAAVTQISDGQIQGPKGEVSTASSGASTSASLETPTHTSGSGAPVDSSGGESAALGGAFTSASLRAPTQTSGSGAPAESSGEASVTSGGASTSASLETPTYTSGSGAPAESAGLGVPVESSGLGVPVESSGFASSGVHSAGPSYGPPKTSAASGVPCTATWSGSPEASSTADVPVPHESFETSGNSRNTDAASTTSATASLSVSEVTSLEGPSCTKRPCTESTSTQSTSAESTSTESTSTSGAPITQINDGQLQAPTTLPRANMLSSAAGDDVACVTANTLNLTLADGILRDSVGRQGYLASNYQFQFDEPPQSGAIVTSGFSVCENGSLALGGSAIFYQCRSGDFYNLYDRWWAEQCEAVTLGVLTLEEC